MKTAAFPASIVEIEPGEFEVRFRDLPEVLTFGVSVEEASLNASDALETVIEHYLDQSRDVPRPSKPREDERLVPIPIATALRLTLIEVMKDRQLSKVALGRLLGKDEKAVRRIVSGRGASIDQSARALRILNVPIGLAA